MRKSFLIGLALLPIFASAHEKSFECITPVRGPLPNNTVDIVLNAEFLYWYSSLSNSSPIIVFDMIDQGDVQEPQSVAVPKKIKEFNWSWDPGFRIGLGVVTDHDGWDLFADWTYYYNSINTSRSVPEFRADLVENDAPPLDLLGTEALSSMWFAEGAEKKFQSVHAHWKLQLNEINLDLGRNYWISNTLTLRPHFGVRTHLSNTEVKVRGNYVSPEDTSDRQRTEANRITQKYWGVGPTGGIDTAWHMTENWSLFANGDVSLVYGRCSLERKMTLFLLAVDQNNASFIDTNFTQHVQHDGVYRTQAIFDFAFGFRFETLVAHQECRLLFDLGWEHHFYPDYSKLEWNPGNPLIEANYFPTDGNLTTSGVVFKARFEF